MSVKLNWGTGIALVYAAFAAATTGFVAFAMSRSVELVSDDYYAQALRQNEQMQAERNTQALQPGPSVARSGPSAILLSLPATHAATASGTITWYRPSDSGADRVDTLALDTSGRQQVSTAALARGRWLLQVRWAAGGRNYYFEEPVILP